MQEGIGRPGKSPVRKTCRKDNLGSVTPGFMKSHLTGRGVSYDEMDIKIVRAVHSYS